MRRIFLVVMGVGLSFFFLGLFQFETLATLKYKKETGKKCTFCHTGIPEPGDEDPQLNRDGERYRENGYQLTEEQKRRPASAD